MESRRDDNSELLRGIVVNPLRELHWDKIDVKTIRSVSISKPTLKIDLIEYSQSVENAMPY